MAISAAYLDALFDSLFEGDEELRWDHGLYLRQYQRRSRPQHKIISYLPYKAAVRLLMWSKRTSVINENLVADLILVFLKCLNYYGRSLRPL